MSSDALVLFPELAAQPFDLHTTGLLPSQKLEDLIEAGHIRANVPIGADQIQPSSLDLRLGSVAYRIRASFLPTPNATVQSKLQQVKLEEFDISEATLLRKDSVYLVPLEEELSLPESISGKANPKSTTGRLDIFTRLITDYGNEFEYVRPGYRGKLYAEIVPLTFSVLVRKGTRLNQLRLRRGSPAPSDAMLQRLHEREPIVYGQDASPTEPTISEGLRLSVNLLGFEGSDIVGYQAKKGAPPIDLACINHYPPGEFWTPLFRNAERSVVLEPGEFYILTSKEKVSIPPDSAAEMVPFDPSVGEFRIHYAGFFDPGFGWGSEDRKGTHAVLEVRSHDVPSLLEHGQVVCRLIYERLLAPPAKLYGQEIGSTYQSQRLALSKQFQQW
ncbi:MAG: 2'-deoxycytidine 5'-triphosphate deaminase [Bryobacteraceae bacterium]|jgi:dCTP deaminase